jgi:simple sugar transport system substrate-binding protein
MGSSITRRGSGVRLGLEWAGVLALVVSACSAATSPSPAPPQGATPGVPATPAAGPAYTFYWISHGSASDPFWVATVQGANKAAADLGVTVNTSFHGGDIAAHKEAFQAAIAAQANGIATSSPETGVLAEEVASAKAAGIPVVFFNTDDPATGRDAFVGANLLQAGQTWAQYLVDQGLVEKGDFVWLPVEVPGATYQVEETKGISSVFDPLGITYEVFDASVDPAQSLSNMTDYLTANASKVDAIIGLGDLVTGNIKTVFDQAGTRPGGIPVVGWGNTRATAEAVKAGYVNAAMWQYPDAQGYDPILLLKKITDGGAAGYDIVTMALYDASSADQYIELTDTP